MNGYAFFLFLFMKQKVLQSNSSFYLRTFFLLIFVAVMQSMSAYDCKVDGIYYNLYESKATVTNRGGSSVSGSYRGNVIIPKKISYRDKEYNVTSIGSSAFYGCFDLTSITIPESVTYIGSMAFAGCSDLTSITIPESVTSIGSGAFARTGWYNNLPDGIVFHDKWCLGIKGDKTSISVVDIPNGIKGIAGSCFDGCGSLTTITLPQSLHYIESEAFKNCTSLTSFTIPKSVMSIGGFAFSGCSNIEKIEFNAENCYYAGGNSIESIFNKCSKLNKVVFGEGVKQIPDYLCYRCTNLTSVTIPESVTDIASSAFGGCSKLFNVLNPHSPTQTTVTVDFVINGLINNGVNCEYYIKGVKIPKHSVDEKKGVVKVGGLYPGDNASLDYRIIVNGHTLYISDIVCKTLPVTISAGNSLSASHIYISPVIDNGDAAVTKKYWKEFKDKSGELLFTGLDPNTSCSYTYYVEGTYGNDYKWKKEETFKFTTAPLTMATLPAQAMNTNTALLCAETNVSDEEVNVGFEWRRYDAPSTLPSSKVKCAVIDGKLTGALSGLNPEAYYNYRPYYTSNSGKTYYGEWITFFTGDASVFFDPTVRTYSPEILSETSAVLKGYALRGSDEIARQGFQYWSSWGAGAKDGSRVAGSNAKEVVVNGQRISYTLSDLQPSTTYYYRTFVETASGTVYGEEQSFTTPTATAINNVDASAEAPTVVAIYNLQGKRLTEPCQGINIIRYSDGTVRRL